MDQRLIEFIGALRAAGVRISIAESLDALRALEQTDIGLRATVYAALQAVLIKERADQAMFARLFPLYFGDSGGDFLPTTEAGLSPAEQDLLQQALQAVLARTEQPHLATLFQAVVEGMPLSRDQLAKLLARVTPIETGNPSFQPWMARRVMRELQLEQLEILLRALLAQLQASMQPAALEQVERLVQQNRAAQVEQIDRAVNREMLGQASLAPARPPEPDRLLDRPLHLLNTEETAELREAVRRMAARLRTRISLRRRRAGRGSLDPKATIRASMPFGGVPFIIRRRRRRLQPRLVVLCDVSSSMRSVAAFMLQLVYALHDQVRHTRAFAYIDELHEISADFVGVRPAQAVATVLARIRADYARTNLGLCLDDFVRDHLDSLDRRTTLLILGDGRNNRSDPGLDQVQLIKSRVHRLIWFTPESRRDWGLGDSDMLQYATFCDAVHVVRTMNQLSAAVEELLSI